MDYKCQGETYFHGVLCDLRKHVTGSTQSASLHVQPGRVLGLQELSIVRDFDPAELQKRQPGDLIGDLEWEEQMDKIIAEKSMGM